MTDFNDSLDALFAGDTGPVRTSPVRAPVDFTPAVERSHTEPCGKCGGNGKFIGYTGRVVGNCFTCKGTGKMTFKNSADTREANRAKVAARKANRQAEDLQTWATNNPAEFAWLESTAPRWALAASLLDAVKQYGDLTEKQLAVVHNGMARDAARAEARANVPAPSTIDISKLTAAFSVAVERATRPGQMGTFVKPIRLLADNGVSLKFAPGSPGSQWEGQMFVKTEDGKKLGSIKDGKFSRKFDCTEVEAAAVLDCAQDPEKTVVAYAKAYSKCGVCGRGLLNDESIARAMGPICAARFGW